MIPSHPIRKRKDGISCMNVGPDMLIHYDNLNCVCLSYSLFIVCYLFHVSPYSSLSNPFFPPLSRTPLAKQTLSLSLLQSRSPRHSQSTQSGLADQAAKLSFASAESLAETMSEADIPLGFSRTDRFRQSLPLSRSASQNKLRSPGETQHPHWSWT